VPAEAMSGYECKPVGSGGTLNIRYKFLAGGGEMRFNPEPNVHSHE